MAILMMKLYQASGVHQWWSSRVEWNNGQPAVIITPTIAPHDTSDQLYRWTARYKWQKSKISVRSIHGCNYGEWHVLIPDCYRWHVASQVILLLNVHDIWQSDTCFLPYLRCCLNRCHRVSFSKSENWKKITLSFSISVHHLLSFFLVGVLTQQRDLQSWLYIYVVYGLLSANITRISRHQYTYLVWWKLLLKLIV